VKGIRLPGGERSKAGRGLAGRASNAGTPPLAAAAPPITAQSPTRGAAVSRSGHELVDLRRRRDQLSARVAELQFDLGGLVYEMATRDRIRIDVLVRRAAVLQSADAELNEVERILRLEQTSTAGACGTCGAPHSSGAAFCWQCGQPILQQVSSDAIGAP
jgi:hypothetical protein